MDSVEIKNIKRKKMREKRELENVKREKRKMELQEFNKKKSKKRKLQRNKMIELHTGLKEKEDEEVSNERKRSIRFQNKETIVYCNDRKRKRFTTNRSLDNTNCDLIVNISNALENSKDEYDDREQNLSIDNNFDDNLNTNSTINDSFEQRKI